MACAEQVYSGQFNYKENTKLFQIRLGYRAVIFQFHKMFLEKEFKQCEMRGYGGGVDENQTLLGCDVIGLLAF